MTDALQPVPARVPLGKTEDGKAVYIERAWLDYLSQQLFNRAGGTSAPTNSELVVDMSDDAGLEELKSEFFKAVDGLASSPTIPDGLMRPHTDDQAPPGAFFTPDAPSDGRIQALEAELFQLRTLVHGLMQGAL